MKDGRISEIGTYEQLLASKGAFADFLIEQLQDQREEEDFDNNSAPQGDVDADETNEEIVSVNGGTLSEAEKEDLKAKLEKTIGKREMKKKMAEKYSVPNLNRPFQLIFCHHKNWQKVLRYQRFWNSNYPIKFFSYFLAIFPRQD